MESPEVEDIDTEDLNLAFLDRREHTQNAEAPPKTASVPDRIRNPKGAGRKRGSANTRAAILQQEAILEQQKQVVAMSHFNRMDQLQAARQEKQRKREERNAELNRALTVACSSGTPFQKWLATYTVQQLREEPLPDTENEVVQVMNSSEHIGSWTVKALRHDTSYQKVQTSYMRVAEAFLQSAFYLWGCFLSRVHDLISNHGFVGLVIGRKRRYDESPFRLRLQEDLSPNPLSSESSSKGVGQPRQTVGTAKIMQSEFGIFALLKRWDSRVQAFHYQEVHGMCPTWLHAIEKNSAENIASTQRDILQSIPMSDEFLSNFKFKVDFPCTDRHPSNMSAERSLQSESLAWVKSHSPCLVHKAASIQAAQFKLVSGHISGMLSMGLSMQASGTTVLLKKILSDIIAEKLCVFYGEPPSYFATHRQGLHDLFLPESQFDQNSLLHKKQRCILSFFMNGNLQDNQGIHFWTLRRELSRDMILPVYTKYVVAALLPHKCPYFNRSKWLGGELNLRWNGLLSTHHGILADLVSRWVAATSNIPVGKPPAQAAAQSQGHEHEEHACLTDEFRPKGSWDRADREAFFDRRFQSKQNQKLHLDLDGEATTTQSADAGKAGNDAVEEVEKQIDEERELQESTDANIDWHEFNRANKRKALAWANTNPGPVLVAMQLCMRPSIRFLCTLVLFASEAWKQQCLAKAAQREERKASAVEVYWGSCFETFRSGIASILFSEIKAMPAEGMTGAMRTLAFRMLSRSLCAAHQLIMCYGQGCPAKLFGALKGHIKELLELPMCLHDEMTQEFIKLFPTHEDMESEDAVHMLKTLAQHYAIDILDLERNHASIRRVVQTKSIHTWTVSYQAACSHWILRQSASIRKRFRATKVKRTISKKKTRKQTQAGGSWRAFLHVHAKGKKFTKTSIKTMAASYREAKRSQDFQVVSELGRLANMAAHEGKASMLKHPKIRRPKTLVPQLAHGDPSPFTVDMELQLHDVKASHRKATQSSKVLQEAQESTIVRVSNELEEVQNKSTHGLPVTSDPVCNRWGSSFLYTPGNPLVAEFCVPMDDMAKDCGGGRAG